VTAAPAPVGRYVPRAARRPERRSWLGRGIAASAVAHAALVAAVLFWPRPERRAQAPVYRVSMVAAPPGPRAEGVVTPAPTPPTPTPPVPAPTPAPPTPAPAPATPPRARETAPREMPAPKSAPEPARRPPAPRATPNAATPARPAPSAARPAPGTRPAPVPPPRAGGGPEGGRGTDVANVDVRGLDFPFPGYLQNIVRQVALRFAPPNRDAALQADVAFLIHRDGTVSNVRLVKRSGSYAFDLEAQGAVEAVGAAKAFGPLPEAFREDVLPVTFSFDPRVIR
jgi:protein TonB